MKMILPSLFSVALLVSIGSPSSQAVARAQSPSFNGQNPAAQANRADRSGQQDGQDEQGMPRVARLQQVQGDVSFERSGDTEWVEAVRNLPLLTGDQVYTGDRSSAVIQLGLRTSIRLSERTAVALTDLSEQGAQFEITSGSAVVQLYRLKDVFGRFEVDTPVIAAVLERDGAYRVQVADSGETEVAVHDGLAEVTTEDATLKVRQGFRLQAGGKGSGKLDVVAIASFDDWDLTGSSLDTTIDAGAVAPDQGRSASPDYVDRYQDTYSSLYGLDELSGCGTWTNVPSYGNCWIPTVAHGWAPYRSGRWLWVPTVGWTWLPSEPWGWAPYHYGRWSFIPGLGWAWVPGFGPGPIPYRTGHQFYAWRPALVYFFNYSTPGGRYVGWQPLRPGEVWHRPGWYESHATGWRRPIYASNNGVSVLPIGAFNGSAAGRPEAPNLRNTGNLQGLSRPGAPSISAGLAGVRPGRVAGVPVRPVDGNRTLAIQPPSAVISRPVLTLHLPAPTAGPGASGPRVLAPGVLADDGNQLLRERRLVLRVPPTGQGLVRGSAWGWAGNTSQSSGDSLTHKDKATNQDPEQYHNQQFESGRHDFPRYDVPANRSTPRFEREAGKSSGGTSGSTSNGSGNQYRSGGGYSQPHTDSHQSGGGGQNSGSSSPSGGQTSGSSGHSGGNSDSSGKGQPSRKN